MPQKSHVVWRYMGNLLLLDAVSVLPIIVHCPSLSWQNNTDRYRILKAWGRKIYKSRTRPFLKSEPLPWNKKTSISPSSQTSLPAPPASTQSAPVISSSWKTSSTWSTSLIHTTRISAHWTARLMMRVLCVLRWTIMGTRLWIPLSSLVR